MMNMRLLMFLIWMVAPAASRVTAYYDPEHLHVDRSFRNLTEFDVSILPRDASEVVWLSLKGNNLDKFPADISATLPSIQKINLADNHRIRFPADGSPFLISPSLAVLDFERCGIEVIFRQSLRHLAALEILILTNNSITRIETSAFRWNRNIQKLYLNQNKLTTMSVKMLKGLFHITELDLSDNRELAPMKGHPFLASDALRILKCNRCGFTVTEVVTFSELTQLKQLHLRGNKLLAVPFLPAPTVVLVRVVPTESTKVFGYEWKNQEYSTELVRRYRWQGFIPQVFLEDYMDGRRL